MALRTLRSAQSLAARRPFSLTSRSNAYKDDQDKDSLKRTSHEYSLTGSDEAAAENVETSFGSKHNTPEEALDNAESESKRIGQSTNPLNVSPANVEVSKAAAHRPEHESIEQGLSRETSKGGKPVKGGRGRLYAGQGELSSTDKGPSSAQTGREEKKDSR
ncbi:hypothetical protein CB0940_04370 [Cercospora beticola]|uniref:Uncharacterized protein n=1 Tax=Cercospora beticola TaxID=122368 RepID=A0A2G5HMA0_CERBT|nr:hypothetical protein CB0940_04370 [Cercospora beticola]PIA93684.1 hypothetical protein CB0940_04370 [Cercospora beticola]WPB01605.1 hypothetical protein RHO25_006234 [Cercospora beticola]CAK1363596.1 unnamed protein product [Cercospora beticola]